MVTTKNLTLEKYYVKLLVTTPTVILNYWSLVATTHSWQQSLNSKFCVPRNFLLVKQCFFVY